MVLSPPGFHNSTMNILLLTSLLASLLSAGTALHQTAEHAAVVDKFNEYKIPEDLGINFQPQVFSFKSSSRNQIKQTALTPAYKTIENATTYGPFVILMVDPDAPTPQNRSFSLVLSNTIEAISPYNGTSPIRSSGPHRYIFLMYKLAVQPTTGFQQSDGRHNYDLQILLQSEQLHV
ncbi:hypothetical protein D9613_007397 [Agrocybe pediades]|uniref:Uncharacterized protein n=1 Tax=Agrocybe pediades TaxID=84607 RepID=A0A8H4QML3_9AGAR|nr:hypothetical protein D9613_007397 [Agrocybe pediades]